MTTINLTTQHPRVYRRISALSAEVQSALEEAGLDATLGELVRIRVSQLNGCAYCLRMHTRDALAAGESTDRLSVVAAWWESQYFTPVERAALALAEDITGLPRETRAHGELAVLTDEQHSALAWLAIVMNAWNRVAVHSHYPVGEEPGAQRSE